MPGPGAEQIGSHSLAHFGYGLTEPLEVDADGTCTLPQVLASAPASTGT